LEYLHRPAWLNKKDSSNADWPDDRLRSQIWASACEKRSNQIYGRGLNGLPV